MPGSEIMSIDWSRSDAVQTGMEELFQNYTLIVLVAPRHYGQRSRNRRPGIAKLIPRRLRIGFPVTTPEDGWRPRVLCVSRATSVTTSTQQVRTLYRHSIAIINTRNGTMDISALA